MNLILLTHPPSAGSQSMPKVARLIGEGMKKRGHEVDYWTSPAIFGRIRVSSIGVKKWLGYLDQYVVFPIILRCRLFRCSPATLFIFIDQALGPWVPAVADRPHVIHCNDFLAIRSAKGEFPENPTGWTGRIYQKLILRGLKRGGNFISISKATKEDQCRLIGMQDKTSGLVYLELNYPFRPLPVHEARSRLTGRLNSRDENGFLLHVGGNQWYKNREGVIELYRAWAATITNPIPLWLIGAPPSDLVKSMATSIPNGGEVRFVCGVSDEEVLAAYNLARLVLFPSLEEGFGWPIAEAMACGAPVITTGHPPMTEVGGDAAFYLRRKNGNLDSAWAEEGATLISTCIAEDKTAKMERKKRGFEQAVKFGSGRALDQYEGIYVLELSKCS